MKISKKIKKPIYEELKIFQRQFYKSVSSKITLLDFILRYFLSRKGKQIRPVLILLFGKMISEKINPKIYRAANLVELIHTASLVHDDIVDEGKIRRKFLTINALWNNKISVLVGDFFLSKALINSTENKDYDLLDQVSKAVKNLSEGELFQIQKSRNLNLEEKDYLELITKKTAALFSCCCAVAAISCNSKKVKEAEKFGKYLGIIFQMRDDLFDYSTNRIGKSTKEDIKSPKITLPLIYSLSIASTKEKKVIKSILRNKNFSLKNKIDINKFIEEKKGFDYAYSLMSDFKNKALKVLENFPDNKSKESIKILIDFAIERKY